MNRRQFTALLGSLPVTLSLPTGLSAAAVAKPVTPPAGAYAWAQLIARAQNKCSPEMLARQLRLGPDVAQALFDEMLRDGVLRAPGVAGVARAAKPINATGASAPSLKQRLSNFRDLVPDEEPPQEHDETPPLVKDAQPCLGCDDLSNEDEVDARETQPVQESPRSG